MITKAIRVSDLPLMKNLSTNGKTIIASGRQNYSISLSQVKGKRIISLSEIEANHSDGDRTNTIVMSFDTGETKYLTVLNGQDGDKGKTGRIGEKGDKGDPFSMAEVLSRAQDVLVIVNDCETDDPEKAWSAYQGKTMQEFLNSISQVVMTDEEYQLRFNEQVFVDLEFTVNNPNKSIAIVHNDNVAHKTYVKYWTYEDSDEMKYFILDTENGQFVEAPMSFDIWDDFYLSDTTTRYFTRELETTITNQDTGEGISEWVYTEVKKPTWMDLEFETKVEDTKSTIVYSDTELGDDGVISKDPKEEEIVVSHVPITSISVNGSEVTMPINSILTKTIDILPTNYKNSPIGITYDETKVQVFEDGRIMALEENCTTVVKIFSVENPNIYAEVTINVITLVESIEFNVQYIKAFKGYEQTIQAEVYPPTASDKTIEWSSSDESIATVDQNGKITLISEGNVTIYAAATDGSGKISRIDVTVDTAVSEIQLEDSYEVLIGIPTTIHATVLPENASNKALEWLSDNQQISAGAAPNGVDGQVYMESKVDGTINVRAIDGSGTTKAISIIGKTPVKNIEIDTNALTLDIGDSHQLVAVANDDADNKTIIWASSDPTIASVTQDGLVRAVNGGYAQITATAADGSGTSVSCNVRSVILITDIAFASNSIDIYTGNTYKINYTIYPAEMQSSNLIWYTSDDTVATVANGTITGLSEGKIKVYAMADDNSGTIASADVNVSIATSELLLSDYEVDLHVDDNYPLIATVIPDDTTNQNVEFTSLDPTIASVDVSGNITALREGTTSVFVTTTDGSNLSAECVINVN